MHKYIEKFLGIYGEDRKRLDRDFLKKEFPLAAIFTFATVAYPVLSFLSIYFSARGIAHLERGRRIYFQTKIEELRRLEKRVYVI